MSLFYVTSNLPTQGKTALCSSMAHLSLKKGVNANIVKVVPLSSAVNNAVANYEKVFPKDPEVFSSVLINEASKSLKNMETSSGVTLAEGDSSISTEDQEKLVSETDAEVIVISDYVNGIECAEYAKGFGTNLKGVVINFLPRFAETDVRERLVPEFESLGVTVIGVIPEDRCLLSVSVAQIAERLGGRFISGENLPDDLVLNFMVP